MAVQVLTDSRTIKPWHVVVAYQAFNVIGFLGNIWGRVLPWITTWSLYMTLSAFLIILIAVVASAPSYRPASFVFTDFVNNTGWKPDGMAFILGLINTNWPYAALDCATHIAEEVAQPESRIPLAICITVALGFGTAWVFVIGMLFSLQDIDLIASTPTLVPIIEIFNQSVNLAGAIGLESLIILTGVGCQVACHTWQTRLCWSFARDAGLPGHRYLSHVNQKLDVPFRALVLSCILDGLIGLLYLGSSAAFNS
jgi:choline transport protein